MGMINVMIDGIALPDKESYRTINNFWEHCHGDCCSKTSFTEKEAWFIEMHEEHNSDKTTEDIFEYRWKW